MDRLLYSRAEAAERLSLSRSTIDMLIARGLLGSRKMGHKRLIPHAALVAFSQKNLPSLWAPKRGGKTVRRLPAQAGPEKKEALEAS